MSITIIGTIFTDVKGYPLGNFIPNGRNSGVMKIVHGGVARNVAEDLGRLGLSPDLVALTDRSALASEVVKRLEESGVSTRFISSSDAGMGTWMAIFNDKGDVAANISVRPDLTSLTSLIDAHHEEIFSDSDGIILEIDIEPETVEKIFEYAAMYEKKIYALVSVMDIALQRRPFFRRTECFICNLQEAGMLFGKDLSSFSVPELEKYLAGAALAEGFSKLIVTLGEKGAVFFDCRVSSKDGSILSGFCPSEKTEVIDTTGAGDAFCAGAASALISGRSLADACAAGSRMAAAVITGTENVLPKNSFANQ